jgi:hypothetical protein
MPRIVYYQNHEAWLAVKVSEAKELVLELARADTKAEVLGSAIDPRSPDPGDPGKFSLYGRAARVIHRYDGWHVPIRRSWFEDSYELPEIHDFPFYWYAFAIPKYGKFTRPHYFLCGYQEVREWVLEFDAPLGIDHREHSDWRADFQPYGNNQAEELAYFRWGDEPVNKPTRPSRLIRLDNVDEIAAAEVASSTIVPRVESEAHHRLKRYVAAHPEILGLSADYEPTLEYPFRTGDHVDVHFVNAAGNVAVVEIELEGKEALTIGAFQAIKYRSLAAAENGYTIETSKIRAFLVACSIEHPELIGFAHQYGIALVKIDLARVLE